jgi:hypothetical protein
MDALIRYFFHIDPEALSDEQYFKIWRQLQYVLKAVGRME